MVHWGVGWAQVKQESAFREGAVSPVGASGLAQFMPGTWGDMIKAGIVPAGSTPFDVKYSLEAQAYYMSTQLAGWQREGRTYTSWVKLALAGYNAGRGHLYTAQRKCYGVMEYADIMKCLPAVTGQHSQETSGYVEKIETYYFLRFGGKHEFADQPSRDLWNSDFLGSRPYRF